MTSVGYLRAQRRLVSMAMAFVMKDDVTARRLCVRSLKPLVTRHGDKVTVHSLASFLTCLPIISVGVVYLIGRVGDEGWEEGTYSFEHRI